MKMAEEYQEISSSSIQGGTRSIGEIEPTLIGPTPPTTARQSLVSKREAMDFDSGTATGTEFSSSSPDSNRSEHLTLCSTTQIQPGYAHQQILSIYESKRLMTPANSVHMAFTKIPIRSEKSDSPQHRGISAPPVEENMVNATERINDNLSKLQKALRNDNFLSLGFPPKSRGSATEKFNSEKVGDNCHDKNLTNSQGKVKKFKCKQCDFFSMTKLDYWEHIKTHMEAGKALTCPHCPFVTEFKHHLLYHLRNHDGLKPFKCDKCSYSGVNRSMLNSHMKTHLNIYQYRCANCPFASKYIHSLKLHLRKSSHSAGMVLNADGTPNPSQIIDVHGTSRGPKIKNTEQKHASPMVHIAANMPVAFTGFPYFPGLLNGIPNPHLREIEKLRNDIQAISPESDVPSGSPPDSEKNETCYLDPSNRGAPDTNDSSEDDDEKEDRRTYTTIFDNVEVVDNSPMVETEDEAETLKLNRFRSKHSPTIVNVNGTRCGPKIKYPGQKPATPNPSILPVTPFSSNQVLATAANISIRFPGFSFYTGFLNGSSSPLMMEIERLTRKMQAVSSLQYGPALNSEVNESCIMDLSKWEVSNRD